MLRDDDSEVKLKKMSVRVRFAPSPTGLLHLGSARTALFNYLFAKKHGGSYILRIEDTDVARNQMEATQNFLENFRWLGLLWDEGPKVGGAYGPYYSSQRLVLYQQYLQQLLDAGQAYYCYCSKQELESERKAAIERGVHYRYSGKCRNHQQPGKTGVVRFKVPQGQELIFKDQVRGEVSFKSDDFGDFIISKADGMPVYNLANVVDDALMKITHVIRGEEHLSNTPLQLMLYEALGWQPPLFAHLPLILSKTGKKLSKRDESTMQFVEQYRTKGYLKEAVINYLALLGWSPPEAHKEEELFSIGQIINLFDLERISKAGAVFDLEKLKWMNASYLKKLSDNEFKLLVQEYLAQQSSNLSYSEDWYLKFSRLFKDSVSSFDDLQEQAAFLLHRELRLAEEAQILVRENQDFLALAASVIQKTSNASWESSVIGGVLKDISLASSRKGKQLFLPIRAAVMGELHGPDLKLSMELLGRECVIKRLQVTENF
ncbi:MAG: glutamate--tRNA ligase [Bacillota bacterium]